MKRRLARGFLRLAGWHPEGQPPSARKCVLIAAPHTSNWDLLYMLSFAWSFGLRPRFMMKHSVFVGPAGWLFRQLGGIPIERSRRYGVVKQMADVFAGAEDLMLLVPPEGTRARTRHWKSGFYHIAREARVPIALTYLDYRRRAAGFGPTFLLTDNMGLDMDRVRAFYADKSGLHPELSGPIRLEEEPDDALLVLPRGDAGP